MDHQTYGRYILGEKLRQGGMGDVYIAFDPRFERNVALKLLPSALLGDPAFLHRFTKEAKLIARLEHSAIVPVHDFGERHGQPFIVMRLMTGGSLATKLEQDPPFP